MVQRVRSDACLCLTATGTYTRKVLLNRQLCWVGAELKTGGADQGWRAIKPGYMAELYSHLTPE
jgi:hypothetical protein